MTDTPHIRAGVMSLEDFIARFEREGPFEILAEEIVPKMPNVFGHAQVANRLAQALNAAAAEQGEAFIETTFIRPEDVRDNWVKGSRVPDVMYISRARLDAYKATHPDWRARPLMLVPELVAEIVSATDRYSEVQAKVRRYLGDGVTLVWVVDPQRAELVIHTQGSNQQTHLSGEALLRAESLLPDLALPLSHLFG